VTPRYALLGRPIPELSLYGSYAENFGVSNFASTFGLPQEPLPPQEAEQWEVGLKTELFGGRLTGTLAWFDLTKTNVPVPSPDPVEAALGVQVATGEATNRGLELDLSGEILPGWNLIGSYAYTDSEITKDRGLDFVNLDPDGNPTITDGNQGNHLFGVPRHSGSAGDTDIVSATVNPAQVAVGSKGAGRTQRLDPGCSARGQPAFRRVRGRAGAVSSWVHKLRPGDRKPPPRRCLPPCRYRSRARRSGALLAGPNIHPDALVGNRRATLRLTADRRSMTAI